MMDPHAVELRLRGDLADEELGQLLDVLRADPDWRVLAPFERAPERIIQMVYLPTGAPYGYRTQPIRPGLWHVLA